MVQKRHDLTGKIFGRLLVLGYSHTEGWSYWKVLCTCGERFVTRGTSLTSMGIKSCGCAAIKHGHSNTRIYSIWYNMRKRIHVMVCKKWEEFKGFYEDMKEGYEEELYLVRKDPEKPYEKSNCHWGKRRELKKLRYNSVEHEGKTIREWSQETSINYSTLYQRIVLLGWPWEKALSQTPRKKGRYRSKEYV